MYSYVTVPKKQGGCTAGGKNPALPRRRALPGTSRTVGSPGPQEAYPTDLQVGLCIIK